jgi:hypothetical protein
MAAVLNRTTKQYLPSANTPDYPVESWIHNPDLSGVIGFDSRYWVITGDAVTLMSQAQRDALNASILVAARDALVNQLTNLEDLQRAFMLAVLDELNLHADKINALKASLVSGSVTNIATMKTSVTSVADYPQRTATQLRTAIRNKLGV